MHPRWDHNFCLAGGGSSSAPRQITGYGAGGISNADSGLRNADFTVVANPQSQIHNQKWVSAAPTPKLCEGSPFTLQFPA